MHDTQVKKSQISSIAEQEEHHHTSSPIFSPRKEIDANELSFPSDFYYAVKDSWVEELGFQRAFLYSMIVSLSTKKGYCFMKDKSFAERMRVSVRTIERWMSQLDSSGYIYRNTFQSRQGKKRHLVPTTSYIDYWKGFLNRKCVPDEIKRDYLKKIFGEHPPKEFDPPIEDEPNMIRQKRPLSPPPAENDGLYASDKKGGSLLLRNSNNKKEQQREAGGQDVAVVSFEDTIKKQLRISGITGERVKMAILYYQKNKKLVDSKKNPIGWIIQGVKKGWAADVVTKPIHYKKSGQPKKPLPKPRRIPKPLTPDKAKKVEQMVKRYKELVDPKQIIIELAPSGFFWEASNHKGFKTFNAFNQPGSIGLLRILAINMNQAEALEYIEKLMNDEFYANL